MPYPFLPHRFVTGASRGIGYATARALARTGVHVVAVARTQGGLEELDDPQRRRQATLVPLNFTDFEGIARSRRMSAMASSTSSSATPVLPVPPPAIEMKPERRDGDQRVGNQPIRCMEPLLKRSDDGRAVFVTWPGEQGHRPSRPLCRLESRGAGAGLHRKPRAIASRQPVQPRSGQTACAPRCFLAKTR
jgi:hypothetical protein